MKKNIKKNAGFSLVELMVVVAIIGVLASIAVPNYLRFQAKAKQSEAKGALAGIYTAEKAFFVENTAYSAVMATIGYAPDGFLQYYNVGFGAAAGQGFACGAGAAAVPASCASVGTNWATAAGAAPLNVVPGVTAGPPATFVAGARGNVNNGGVAANFDQWKINANKTLQNTVIGI